MTAPALQPNELLFVRTRAAWRCWLAANHASAAQIWLVYLKKHTGAKSVTYDEAVEEALCFGWIDSIVRRLDDDRYAQKFTPRKASSKWSRRNLERLERLTAQGRMTPAGIHAATGASERALTTPAQAELADGIARLVVEFKRDKAALNYFKSLAPSHKRNYAHWIFSAKKDETKQKRIAEAIEMLKRKEKLGLK